MGIYDEPSFHNSWTPSGKSYLNLFLHALPFTWMKDVLLPTTAETMDTQSPNCIKLSLDEFLCYLGICLLMSTCIG